MKTNLETEKRTVYSLKLQDYTMQPLQEVLNSKEDAWRTYNQSIVFDTFEEAKEVLEFIIADIYKRVENTKDKKFRIMCSPYQAADPLWLTDIRIIGRRERTEYGYQQEIFLACTPEVLTTVEKRERRYIDGKLFINKEPITKVLRGVEIPKRIAESFKKENGYYLRIEKEEREFFKRIIPKEMK